MRLAVREGELGYETCGPEGAPWVTLSHAILTDRTLWDELAMALAPHFRVLRYDTRGHGDSTTRIDAFGFDRLAEDVVALWDALRIERSAFVGLSLGAMTGLRLAIDQPDRLTACVLADLRADAPEAFRTPWKDRIALARAEGVHAVGDPMIGRWLTPATLAGEPQVAERLRRMVDRASVAGYVGSARALQGLDLLPRAGEVRTPTLLLAGGEDGLFRDATRDLAARISGARYVEIEGAGHAPNLERPEPFAQAVREHLDRYAR